MKVRKTALAAETLGYLVVAFVAVAALPFRHVEPWIAGPGSSKCQSPDPRVIRTVCKLVAKWGNRPVSWAVCLPQALAAHWMLRRRGIPSVIRFGVQRQSEGNLAAHAWLYAGGAVVLGAGVAADFTQIAELPRRTSRSLLKKS